MVHPCTAITAAAIFFSHVVFGHMQHRLHVQISVADGLLNSSTNGRVVLLLAPAGTDPLEDTDVTSSPNFFFGRNVYHFGAGDQLSLSGGSGKHTSSGVFGWPNVSMDEVPAGDYTVQAFLNPYEAVTRSDGSVVSLPFPCGDGAPMVAGFGSLTTPATNVTVSGSPQTIALNFTAVVPVDPFRGTEIGGCSQGNYADTETLKHVKIRSSVLSEFWYRDIYVGANVRLPHGYNATDTATRYPVIYSQDHWAGGDSAFAYYQGGKWMQAWDSGIIPGVNGTADRETPKLILVTFRHEAPYYDDSYAVNTANLGPYGDAINDELIPHLDSLFNTIAEPYARIQEGGSTGGWSSAASLIFRPDLFGACFSSYPDSLDFHRHQDIPLYDAKNAYTRPNGSSIYSIREVINGTLTDVTTVAQENHWELTFGTSSRSSAQWDVWNAVFGAQGLNGYPLEPWDKVTGEIYPEAVEYWKPMDLSHHITSHWNATSKNLGQVLRNRIFIYVGSWDNYFLNEGVQEFSNRVNAQAGANDPNWANITILPHQTHGGLYQRRELWPYLEFLLEFISDHAPDGPTPLSPALTSSTARGNQWNEVLAHGGRQAALARQADPEVEVKRRGQGRSVVEAKSVGRWDPGMKLVAEWIVDGEVYGKGFNVTQGELVTLDSSKLENNKICQVQLQVVGRKRGYVEETRMSNVLEV